MTCVASYTKIVASYLITQSTSLRKGRKEQNMKKTITTGITLVLILCLAFGTTALAEALTGAEIVSDFATTRYFSDEAVSEDDVSSILLAGVNTASASNRQPWHFTAIADAAQLQAIEDAVNARRVANGQAPLAEPEEGKAVDTSIAHVPLLIIVSAEEGAELNAGLATQNMAIMAQLLGYGTKIETSPASAINDNADTFYETFGIPEGQKAMSVIKIGKADTSVDESLDGFTFATERNPFDEVTTIVAQ